MTTVVRTPLQTPAVDSSRFAVGRTSRAADAQLLVDLCNDAAGGHPPQNAAVGRHTGDDLALFYDPTTSARVVCLAITASWRGTWNGSDYAVATLAITDGTTTVSSGAAEIPSGLDGATPISPTAAAGRFASLGRYEFYFDRDALITAGLSATAPWAFLLTTTCDPTVYVESVELAEVSRFAVDAQDNPQFYQRSGAIVSTLSRITSALETTYDRNRRTYHHIALPKADALTVTAGAFAAIPGIVQSEAVGVPTVWTVPPRHISGLSPARFAVRYKTSGASNGYVRLTTGVAAYSLTLPGTSNVWANLFTGSAQLKALATDTLYWEAMVDGGTTLRLATFWVADTP